MLTQAAYRCPHCQNTVDVPDDLMGEIVECGNCQQQFQAQAPIVHPKMISDDKDKPRVSAQIANSEEVLREFHPVMFRNHLFLTTIALLFTAAGIAALISWAVGQELLGIEGIWLMIGGIFLTSIAAIYFLTRWIQKLAITMKITSQRTVVTRGIIAKSTNEVQHDDVRNIKSDRNIMERLLNYGDIALSSSGQDDMEIVVHDIPDPEGVIMEIRAHQ